LRNKLDITDEARRQVLGEALLTRPALDEVVHALDALDPQRGHECRHTARALFLLASRDLSAREVGEAYLISASEAAPGERNHWGIHPDPKTPHQIVGELSRLLSLTGPSVVAVDQIDTLISQSLRPTDEGKPAVAGVADDSLLDQIGNGLMAMRETMQRTVSVVACQDQVKMLLDPATVTGADIATASAGRSQGAWVVTASFKPEGQAKFTELTRQIAGAQGSIAIVLDNEVVSAPQVQGVIPGDVQVAGSFSESQARNLAAQLSGGGELPVALTAD
jgi:hypothetical protein